MIRNTEEEIGEGLDALKMRSVYSGEGGKGNGGRGRGDVGRGVGEMLARGESDGRKGGDGRTRGRFDI